MCQSVASASPLERVDDVFSRSASARTHTHTNKRKNQCMIYERCEESIKKVALCGEKRRFVNINEMKNNKMEITKKKKITI